MPKIDPNDLPRPEPIPEQMPSVSMKRDLPCRHYLGTLVRGYYEVQRTKRGVDLYWVDDSGCNAPPPQLASELQAVLDRNRAVRDVVASYRRDHADDAASPTQPPIRRPIQRPVIRR